MEIETAFPDKAIIAKTIQDRLKKKKNMKTKKPQNNNNLSLSRLLNTSLYINNIKIIYSDQF